MNFRFLVVLTPFFIQENDDKKGKELHHLKIKLGNTEEELQGEKGINSDLRKEIAELKDIVTAKEFKSITDIMMKFSTDSK